MKCSAVVLVFMQLLLRGAAVPHAHAEADHDTEHSHRAHVHFAWHTHEHTHDHCERAPSAGTTSDAPTVPHESDAIYLGESTTVITSATRILMGERAVTWLDMFGGPRVASLVKATTTDDCARPPGNAADSFQALLPHVLGAAAAGSPNRRAHPSAETSCCTQRTARQRAISAPGIAAGWAGDSRGRSGAWPSFRCDSAARICPSRPLRSSFLVGHHRDASRSRGHDLHAFTSRQTCRRAIRPRAAGSSCRSPLRATPAREDAAPPSRLRESRELARLA